jgi:hypothetical protein
VLTRPWRPGIRMLGCVSGQILVPMGSGNGGSVGTAVAVRAGVGGLAVTAIAVETPSEAAGGGVVISGV